MKRYFLKLTSGAILEVTASSPDGAAKIFSRKHFGGEVQPCEIISLISHDEKLCQPFDFSFQKKDIPTETPEVNEIIEEIVCDPASDDDDDDNNEFNNPLNIESDEEII